jgi:histone acetyltransferase MYST1
MQSLEELAPLDQHLEKQHQEKTKVKNINVVEMGKFVMDTW